MPRKPTGNPRGRPRGTGTIGEDQERLTVRIPGELYNRFVAFAEGRSFTRGAPQLAVCVREALDHYLTCQYKRQTGNILPAGEDIKRQTEKSTAVRDAVVGAAAEEPRQTMLVPDAGVRPAELESISQPKNGHARSHPASEQERAETEDNKRQTATLPTPFAPTHLEGAHAPDPDEAAFVARRAAVLAAIPPAQDAPAGVSPATLRQRTGYDKPAVANDLRALLKRGAVVRVGDGHYVRA